MIEFISYVLYYHKMKFALSQLTVNKRHIRQSLLTLLLFCATLFFHNEHYGPVEPDTLSNFKWHDCHLCQQGIDAPPNVIRLYPVSTGITNSSNARIIKIDFTAPDYVYPLLRAPPRFSHHLMT